MITFLNIKSLASAAGRSEAEIGRRDSKERRKETISHRKTGANEEGGRTRT
jgi:hypothetical protein